MYINKKFLDFMLTNKMHYEGKTDSTFMVKEPQGVLVVTKGRIAMADPYAINYGIVVTEDIPNDKFPIYTFTARLEPHDEVHVAGFLLQFDEEAVPDEWKMCLPADINGVSCKDGEVEASVFDRYRDPLYKEASYKPYIIAAMIMLAKFQNPVETLEALAKRNTPRKMK